MTTKPRSRSADSARGTLPQRLLQPESLSPLGGSDLVSEVVQRLRAHILDGHIEVGGELPSEGQLCRTFEVSRTVVREAMRILRWQGLVEFSQGRRPRVKPADPRATIESLDALLSRSEASLEHLTEVRRPLEVEIAVLAAQRAEPQHLDALEQANRELESAANLAKRVEADIRFHRVLAESTGNPLFVLLLETVAQLLRQSRRRTISESGVELALEEHRRILATVRQRDPDAARQAMLQHMQLIQRDLRVSRSRRQRPET